VTKRRIEQLQTVFDRVATLLQGSNNLEDVAEQLIALLGQTLACEWGTFWKVDSSQQRLKPIASWSAPAVQADRLVADTKNRTLSLSEGTAGHVWRGRKPIWTLDLVKDMCLPRSLDAQSAGLHGGIWFAIKTDTAVYAVIELLGRKILPPNQELMVGIEGLGLRLGHLLEERTEH
jgi:GAF domain-containing protein